MQKLFTWLKVYSFPLNVGGFEKEPVVCGIGGSGRHWLWCVATWMSVKQRHSKCSKLTRSVDTRFQSSSPLIDRIIHHTLLSEIQPCLNKPLPPLVHIVNWHLIHIHSCIMLQMRWSTGFRSGFRTVGWSRVRTDELGAEARLCREHDVLVHCLAGRQACLQFMQFYIFNQMNKFCTGDTFSDVVDKFTVAVTLCFILR